MPAGSFLVRADFCLVGGCLLTVPSHGLSLVCAHAGEGESEASGTSSYKDSNPIDQVAPTSGSHTSTGLWSVRNWAIQQEASSRPANEASPVFTGTPLCLHCHMSSASCSTNSINIMRLNHPETMPPSPGLWKYCLPQNQSLVPKRLRCMCAKSIHLCLIL